jgi:hypothetical protein
MNSEQSALNEQLVLCVCLCAYATVFLSMCLKVFALRSAVCAFGFHLFMYVFMCVFRCVYVRVSVCVFMCV